MKWFSINSTILFITFSVIMNGQVVDSISNEAVLPTVDSNSIESLPITDTTILQTDKKRGFVGKLFKEDYPNPKKALLLSAAIPGGGQIYNKRWWKLPFVYGGYVGLILAADFNTRNYRDFRDAYIAELAGEDHKFSETGLDANDLRRLRDGYDKNKQLSYIGIFALHLVQAAEAFVDCHLRPFDVSDDLTMSVSPKFGLTRDGTSYLGLGLSFQLSD